MMKKLYFRIVCFLVVFVIFLSSCDPNNKKVEQVDIIEITKWLNDATSAYSPNYDAGRLDLHEDLNNWLIENDLFVDYELVSASFDAAPFLLETLKNDLMPHGFGYFGHGHTHVNHDYFTYEEAYASMKLNYDQMISYGLKPVSYAYPNGGGVLPHTQTALRNAGFFSGRLFQPEFEEYGPYILPGDETVPPNWFALPSIRMESIAFNDCVECVNDTDELMEHIRENIELRSWLISTYHGIGWDGITRPEDWGYYHLHHFYDEMLQIKALANDNKIWIAQFDEATMYIYQRNAAVYTMQNDGDDTWRLYLGDELDRDIFDTPLTLKLSIPNGLIGTVLTIRDPDMNKVSTEVISNNEILVNLKPIDDYYTLEFK